MSRSGVQLDDTKLARPLAKFHKDIWGDYFLRYIPSDEATQAKKEQEVKELEEEVRKELFRVMEYQPLEQLNFIDAVQRLGVAYRLEEELEEALRNIYSTYGDHEDEDDIYLTSLRFRLVRQHGFYVSSDIFRKFMDEGGSFKASLATDALGLLSLYEASHLSAHGDDILDEARAFAKSHLKSIDHSQAKYPLAAQVSHALNQSLHRGMPRLESRHFISFYEKNPSHNKVLLRFAKLDFNLLQSSHKRELQDLTRWWKGYDFVKKLPFTRDRMAEAYFWTLGAYYEPQFSLGRKIFCQVFKVMSIIDDTYDAYGTIEELVPYTEAIVRWDRSCLDELPGYMKLSYEFLLDTFEGFERDLAEEGRSYCVHYAKEALKVMCQAYLQEAKWLHEKYIPTYEEYMTKAAIVSFGYQLGTVVAFLGMGKIASKEAFIWDQQPPKSVVASGLIGRLMDDMASHTFEQGRGHVPSAVECYMKQYGSTEEATRQEFQKYIENAWKDINHAMDQPSAIPRPLLTVILNTARVVDVIYKSEDGYTFPGKSMKDHIVLTLTDPIAV